MKEISEGEIQTTTMNHHGLVAAVCQDLKTATERDSLSLEDCAKNHEISNESDHAS